MASCTPRQMKFYCTVCEVNIQMSYSDDATYGNVLSHIKGGRHRQAMCELDPYRGGKDGIFCNLCRMYIYFSGEYYHDCDDLDQIEQDIWEHVTSSWHNNYIDQIRGNPAQESDDGSQSAAAASSTQYGSSSSGGSHDYFWCSICACEIPAAKSSNISLAKLNTHISLKEHEDQVKRIGPGFIICSLCDCRIPGSYSIENSYRSLSGHIFGYRHSSAKPQSESEASGSSEPSSSSRWMYEDEDSYDSDSDPDYSEYTPERSVSDSDDDYPFNGNTYPENKGCKLHGVEPVSSLYLPD